MKFAYRTCLMLAALALLALAGCSTSTQDAVSPPPPAASDQQAVAAAMDHLLELVTNTSSEPTANPKEWSDIEAAMARYGVALEPADKSSIVPLPKTINMAVFAAQAMEAVNAGDWWPVLTSFRDYPEGGNCGFSMCWLVELGGYGPGHYLCNVYVDRPSVWPEGTIEVLPYTLAIQQAANRQYIALSNPEEAIFDHSFRRGDYINFDYVYSYHSEIGDRVGQMMQFRLAILQ